MTKHYQLTKDIHNGEMIYKCIRCEKVWSMENKEPLEYKLPPYIEVSGGLCDNCLEEYFALKRLKDD